MLSAVRVFCTVAFAHSLPVQIVTHHAGDSPMCLTWKSFTAPWPLLDDCGRAGFWEFIDGKVVWANRDEPQNQWTTYCLVVNPSGTYMDELLIRLCTDEHFEAATWSLDSDTGTISSGSQCVQARDFKPSRFNKYAGLGYAQCDGSDQQRWHFRSATYYQVQSTAASLCVDVPGGDTSNGAALWMWECSDEGENQKWYLQGDNLIYLPDGGLSELYDPKCLTLLGGGLTSNGNRLGIWDCNYDSLEHSIPTQQWGFDSELGTLYLASSKASNATKCAQIAGENVGDPLVIWDCTIEPHQVWTVPTLDVQVMFAAVV